MDDDDDVSAVPATSFHIFSDRTASDLCALEWNASMDLLACLAAPPDSTLSVYRLLSEEQSPKLLSEKIAGIGTALTWSPCGRKVAVGDRLGGVAIYDGETGAVLHARRPHAHPVAALHWMAAEGPDDRAAEPPWSRMLPPLTAVPTAPSNMHSELPDADVYEPDSAAGLSFLVSADESGLVVVSAGGTFPLQATRLFDAPCGMDASLLAGSLGSSPAKPTEGGGASSSNVPPGSSTGPGVLGAGFWGFDPADLATRRVAAVRISPDLRRLSVLLGRPFHTQMHAPATAAPSTPGAPVGVASEGRGGSCSGGVAFASSSPAAFEELSPIPSAGSSSTSMLQGSESKMGMSELVLVLDVRKLAVRRKEISQSAGGAERLLSVAGYARQAVDVLGNVWRASAEGFGNKMRGLSEAIESFEGKEAPSVQQELLLTCFTGAPSDSVHAFLTRQTSPQQLTRLERSLSQALEYVNLIACTRLQVAGHHLLAILHDLHARAAWPQKFQSIGLSVEPLQRLQLLTWDFIRSTELLLIECSKARRFTRTLFQVLLRMSHKILEQPPPTEPGPSQEEMNDFIGRMQRGESLELVEVMQRIRGPLPGEDDLPPPPESPENRDSRNPGQRGMEQTKPGDRPAVSLARAVQRIVAEAEKVGEQIVAALSAHVTPLALMPVCAPSPRLSIALPEFQNAGPDNTSASLEFSARCPCPTALNMTWEGKGAAARLLLVWAGGGPQSETRGVSELHLCRVRLPHGAQISTALGSGVCPPPPAPQFEYARLRACSASSSLASGRAGCSTATHFLLCQMYDETHIVALVLEEQLGAGGAGSPVVQVLLVDIASLTFYETTGLGDASCSTAQGAASCPVVSLQELPEGAVRRSAPLSESYIFASEMRAMASRGVCTIYARRPRRLVTLDLAAEAEEEDDE